MIRREFGVEPNFLLAWLGLPDDSHPCIKEDLAIQHLSGLRHVLDALILEKPILTFKPNEVMMSDLLVPLSDGDMVLMAQTSFRPGPWIIKDQQCQLPAHDPWHSVLPVDGEEASVKMSLCLMRPTLGVGFIKLICLTTDDDPEFPHRVGPVSGEEYKHLYRLMKQ